MKRSLTFLFILFASMQFMYAQDATISGTIIDDDTGEPLYAVNVIQEGTSNGTTTDFDGKYELTVPVGSNIVFSYIGYENFVVTVDASKTMDIRLKEEAVSLAGVVVSASKRKEKILDAPASVSVITSERIESQANLTAIDNLKKTPGVDIMTTGLVSANVNLRGFNGIFDGSMLTMVDNRIGRVPSLRVNAFQLIPGNDYDVDKMEVVRGPGSALYGPNAADGVLHIITKSPIDIDKKVETAVALTSGFRTVILDQEDIPDGAGFSNGDFRTVFKPEIRTAIKFSEKAGFKISGRFMQGDDWEYYDPREPVVGQPIRFGTVQNGEVWQADPDRELEFFNRDFGITNYNVDSRLDLRPTNDTEIIFAGGLSSSQNLELTGLGAAQSQGWKYWYAQARFRFKDLYVQYFVNSSNAGNSTYLIPQGTSPLDTVQMQLLIDRSKLHVVQLQHSYDKIDKLQLIYGLDVLLTRPNSDGTINGRFEDEDNINQYGGYVQGEYELSRKFKFVAAARVDYHDVIQETFFSPRAALVYKPAEQHTIRATYNRAFNTPSSLNLALDLANGVHPLWNGVANPFNPQGTLMNIRGIGNPNGYNYQFDAESGEVLYKNFWDGSMATLSNTSNNHVYFQNIVDLITAQLQAQAPESVAPLVPNIVAGLFGGILGEDGTINNADLAGIDFIEYLETGDVVGSLWNETGDLSSVQNLNSSASETTETYELGYKGIFQSKFFASADFYYTRKSNLRSPLLNKSPFVVVDPNDLSSVLGANEEGGALHDNLQAFNSLIAPLFEGNEDFVQEANGDAWDEIVAIVQGANADLGFGIVTPQDDRVGDDMILTYVNQGDVSLWGADFGFTYLINNNATINAAYSFVNTDRFELDNGDVVFLNAPKNKVSLGYDHLFEKPGVGIGLNARWYQGFDANSAVYIGRVDNYHSEDVKVFYRPSSLEGAQITLDVQNVLGIPYRTFPGTPEIGRMVFLKLAYKF